MSCEEDLAEIFKRDDVGALQDLLYVCLEVDDTFTVPGADEPAIFKHSPSLLCAACYYKSLKCVKELITFSADVQFRDGYDRQPILFAVAGGSLPVIQTLLENGASLDSTDRAGDGVVHYMVHYKRKSLLLWFSVTNTISLSPRNLSLVTPLHLAAEFGCVKAIVALTQGVTGANSVKDVNGRTPLMVASANGHLYAVQEIMKSGGVDVHEVDKMGGSARELARGSYGPNILLALDGKEQKLGLLCNPRTGMAAAKPPAEPAPKKQESGCNVA